MSHLGTLFDEQALRTPDALALVHGRQRLTYRELHDRVHTVATRLMALGVRDETLVAMSFHRGADAVVCMLGIILAGGAYVPVNPSFPYGRLVRILDDARAPLLVHAAAVEANVAPAAPDRTRTVAFETLVAPGDVSGYPVAIDAGPAHASPLAYVMYTSGSTGRPKGVMIEHAGVVRLVKDADYLSFGADERFLQTGALEFDAATFEIWGALLNGATLHVVEHETLVVPGRLKAAVRDADITVMWLTAPLFNQLVDEDLDIFATLRTLLVGGDVLSCHHINRVRRAHPGLRILNGYGPTENTTFTTTFPIERTYETAVPIGRPIRGTTVLVLDPDRRPAAPGQIGELYAGGRGLARGYLRSSALTAERFVHIGGERYYRTGDLVSADAEGVLHFHGRADDQIKIRGHRVEVQEVTRALLDTPGVRDGIVVVTGTGAGRRLLGYAVFDLDATEDSAVRALRRQLPRYMCPEQVVAVPRLPLNVNGKVDAARLPAPPPRTPAPTLSERTPTERRLAGLWEDVLHVDTAGIGPHDDFFELGGTSITAGALIGRIARQTGAALTFQEMFAARTLRLMAKAVEGAARTGLEPIGAVGGDAGTAPLHPQQRGLYALWQVDSSSLAYNVPVRIEVTGGGLDPDRLRLALGVLVERHEALRLRFFTEGGEPRQAVAPVADVGLDIASSDAEATAEFVRPFDLTRPPLLRAMLVRGAADGTADRLYLDVHHIVVDGVSLRVLVDELFDSYAGVVPETPRLRYTDAARWFAGRVETNSERYWLDKFRDVPEPPELPTDHPRPPLRSTRGGLVCRALGTGVTDALSDCAARHRGTPFTVLLSAYVTALARLTGTRDLVVGCPMSGRDHPDVEGVVGMFVNTVPLRLRVAEDDTFGGLLARAGNEHRAALGHQAYPFERLVRQVLPRRDPGRNPLFDVFFALQDIDFHAFRKHGRRITVTLLHPGTCRFDLNLQAYQRPSGLDLELEYGSDLFTVDSAEFLLDRVVAALDELLNDPRTPILRSAPPAVHLISNPANDFTFEELG